MFLTLLQPTDADATPSFGTCVCSVRLEQDVPSVQSIPWIHLILSLVPRNLLPNLEQVNLEAKGTNSSGSAEMAKRTVEIRSMFDGLPRTLPSSHFYPLKNFELGHVRFETFGHLLRTLNSVDSQYDDILCLQLSWSEETSATVLDDTSMRSLAAIRRWKSGEKKVRVQSCRAVWPFFLCLVTTRLQARIAPWRPLYIERTEVHKMLALVHHIADECKCADCFASLIANHVHRQHSLRKSAGE